MSDYRISNIRRLDGALLLVFRELLRCRNATEAAKRLSLTQSAVSHALTRLRSLFGDPLFVRRAHGLEPTRRALELAPRVDALIDLAAATIEGEHGFDPAKSERRFRLAAPEFVTALIGAPLIARLRRSAPKVSLRVEFLFHEPALDALRRGEIDLALGRFGKLRRTGLAVDEIFEDRYCVVARKKHPRLSGAISLTEYDRMGHVFAGSHSEGEPDEVLPSAKLVATAGVVPHWLTALVIVSTTDTITTCPRRLAERQAGLLKLQVLEAPFPTKPFKISAVRRADGADAGVDWLLEQVRASVA